MDKLPNAKSKYSSKYSSIYSTEQFGLFRILLGTHLFVFFARLLTESAELFSGESIFFNATSASSPIWNPFLVYGHPDVSQVALCFALLLSALFTLGIVRKSAAILIWILLIFMADRLRPYTPTFLSYLGWMLIASVFVPKGEAFSVVKKRNESWLFPESIFYLGWIVAAVGYTISAIYKLDTESWVSGNALVYAANSMLGNDNVFAHGFLVLPPLMQKLITWLTLMAEFIVFLFLWNPYSRAVIWWILTFMQILLFLLIDIEEITITVLIFHFFLMSPRLFSKLKAKQKPIASEA